MARREAAEAEEEEGRRAVVSRDFSTTNSGRRRSAGLQSLFLALALPLLSAVAWAHDPPPIDFQAKLTDQHLESFVMIQARLFTAWMTAEGHECEELDADWLDANESVIAEFMHTYGPVSIDTVSVLPIIDVLDFQEGFQANDFIDYVVLTILYSTKGNAEAVTMEWHRYVDADGWPLDKAELLFGARQKLEKFQFTIADPKFTWLQPAGDEAQQPAPIVDPDAYLLEPLPETRLPMLTIGALAALVLVLPVLMLRGAGARPYIFFLATAILIGGLGANVAVVETVLPWERRDPPSEETALQIFESLHRNIYRAFDYVTESEVYDVLAQSVTDELLDETYNEVYDSLVLRNDGNAVCQVRGVERLAAKANALEPSRASIHYRWRVTGTVNHWSHSHLRTNEYTAQYELQAGQRQWRITDVDIQAQTRVDDPETAD
ncbi:MAG: hypothetical protein AAF581_07500 [Planctomycetota bacterium]